MNISIKSEEAIEKHTFLYHPQALALVHIFLRPVPASNSKS